jgi:anti-sigma regulatory factor (Ser/Thr protein kinase)
MHVVGTVALDVGRAPGALAVTRDLCAVAAQAAGQLRLGAGAVARGVVTVLRASGPVVAALMTSFRSLPTSWTATASPGEHFPGLSAAPRRSAHARPIVQAHRELLLPPDPTAPGAARAFLRCAAEEWGVDDDLAQDAAMVITELVANAVDHARSESTLALHVTREGLCVSVRDGRPGPVPRPAPIDPTAARGRGLQMVDALTSAWGVTLHAEGKTVWAVLSAGH